MADNIMLVNVEPYIDLRKLQAQIERETKDIKLTAELVITQNKQSAQKALKEIQNYYVQLEKYQTQYSNSNINSYNLEIKKNEQFLSNYSSLLQKQSAIKNELSGSDNTVASANSTAQSNTNTNSTLQTNTSNPAATLTASLQTTLSIVSQFNTLVTTLTTTSASAGAGLNQLGAAASNSASQYGMAAKEYLQIIQEMGNSNAVEKQSEGLSALSSISGFLTDMTKEYTIAVLGKIATDEAATDSIMSITTATISSATAAGAATTATGLLAQSFQTLKAAFISNPFGAILVGITTTISIATTLFNNYKQQQEEIRANSKELTQAYEEEKQALDNQLDSYKNLYEKLNSSNLTVEETSSVKEQLLTLQSKLNESYDIETEHLDLINGKYEDQISILNQLSKDKAKTYLAENKIGFDEAEKFLSEQKTYKLTGFSGIKLSDEMNDYLENYSKNLDFDILGSRSGEVFFTGKTELKLYDMDVDDAYNFLVDLYNDINDNFGSSSKAESLKKSISKVLNKEFDTERIDTSINTIKNYKDAKVLANPTLGNLYYQSKDAISNYNSAILSGDNIDEAKKSLEEIQELVYQNTYLVEDSDKIFDNLFSTISSGSSDAVGALSTANKQFVTFQDLLSNKQVKEEIRKLEELGKTEPVTPEQIKSSETLMKALSNTALSVEDVAKEINSMSKETESSVPSTNKASDSFVKLTKTVKSATAYVNELGQNVDTSKLQSAVKDAKDNVSELTTILENLDNGNLLPVDVIDTISKKYPQLLSYIGDEKALRNELVNEIAIQQSVADNYYTNITDLDTNYYQKLLKNNSEKVKKFKDYYNINLNDYKSLAEAKYQVDKLLLNTLSEKWAQYYKAQNKTNLVADILSKPELLTDYGLDQKSDQEKKDLLNTAKEEEKKTREAAEKYAEIYNLFKGLIDNNFTLDFNHITLGGNTALNNTSTSTPETKFSEQIDFATERVKILESAINSLQNNIKDSASTKSKLLETLITKQSELYIFHKSSIAKYSSKYENALKSQYLSEEDRKNIQEGNLKIEKFTGTGENSKAEKRYNAYQNAMSARDNLATAKNNAEASFSELKESSQTLAELSLETTLKKIDDLYADIDLLNAKLNSTTDEHTKSEFLKTIEKKQIKISQKYQKYDTDTKTELTNLYEKINPEIRGNVPLEHKIKTYGITDPQQLGYVTHYNKLIDTRKNNANQLELNSLNIQADIDETRMKNFSIDTDKINKEIQKHTDLISKLDSGISFFDEGSTEQLLLLQSGFNETQKKTAAIKSQISALNKEFINGKLNVSSEVFNEYITDLKDQMEESSKAANQYQNDIISAMKKRYDKELELSSNTLKATLDDIEKRKKAELDLMDAQLDKYKESIEARKKILNKEKADENHQKELEEYTLVITKLESRIALLSQAEATGDRTAGKERRELEEQLAEEKNKLADYQSEYGLNKAIEALDEEYSEFEKIKNLEKETKGKNFEIDIENAKKAYEQKETDIKELYETEKNLIIEAAKLTDDEFSKAFASINSTLSSYGLPLTSEQADSIREAMADNRTTKESAKQASTIKTFLQSGTSKKGNSALNKYIYANYGSNLTYSEMVELAKLLGLTDITTIEDVKVGKNRQKILTALKNAKFSTGGTVDATKSSNPITGALGEDGIAFVKHNEEILTPEKANMLRSLLDVAKPLTSIAKLATGTISNSITNHYSSPTIQFNLNGGTITPDAMLQFNNWKNDIVKEVSRAIISDVRKR